MKTLMFTLALAAAGVSTAHAQYYSSHVAPGAVLGGLAGAFIGGHNNDRWGEGAAIGAAAGAILGAVADQGYAQPVAYNGSRSVAYDSYDSYCPPQSRVVVVNRPPAVYCPPAPRVVYGSRYYTHRPVVVVRPREVIRRPSVSYSHRRDDHRDDNRNRNDRNRRRD